MIIEKRDHCKRKRFGIILKYMEGFGSFFFLGVQAYGIGREELVCVT